jgi:hypothetical protein
MIPVEDANERARGLVTAYLSWVDELGSKGYGGRAGDAMATAFAEQLADVAGDPVVTLALVRYTALLCALGVDDEDDTALDLWRRIIAAEQPDDGGEVEA